MTSSAPAPGPRTAKAAPRPGIFVARQPILTKDKKSSATNSCFGMGSRDYFCPEDPEAASRSTLDSSLLMGLDVLCDGSRAFINCTRDMLLKD